MTPYIFDPTKFGFLSNKKVPKQLKLRFRKAKPYVKVIVANKDGTFWYTACLQQFQDDRWCFYSGLYNADRPDDTDWGHQSYAGLITSDEYARLLLIHLLAPCRDPDNKWGIERTDAQSLPIPRRPSARRFDRLKTGRKFRLADTTTSIAYYKKVEDGKAELVGGSLWHQPGTVSNFSGSTMVRPQPEVV